MRKGSNPAKQQDRLPSFGMHRVVVPVYIPNREGYFAQSPEVLRLCLRSLRSTTEGAAAITVVSNGCCDEVVRFLSAERESGAIDQLVLHHTNRGKVDAVMMAARGVYEELVTVADADMLFLPGWLSAVNSVFAAFPAAGFVSPFPVPWLAGYCTSATVLAGLCANRLSTKRVVDPELIRQFAASTGNTGLCEHADSVVQVSLRQGSMHAIVGAGHCVFTTHRDVIRLAPTEPACSALDGSADRTYFDETVDRNGFWRLSTTRTFATHMGNVPDTGSAHAANSPYVERAYQEGPVSPRTRHWTARIPYPVRCRLASAALRMLKGKEMAHDG